MSSSINNSALTNQLEEVLKSFVQEKLELIMKEELENYLKVERPELENSKNGFYERSLDTRYGKIEDLSVPRDRQGEFQTQLFAPYQRRDGWLEEAFKNIYPKADVQRCVVHKVRNTLNRVRKKDREEIAEDLKAIYRSFTRSQAEEQFHILQDRWRFKYPREVSSWEKDLSVLLTFLKYPSSIRSVIYTTNWIERTIKDIRKRLKPMNSLPDIKAAEKIVYLTIQDLNNKWSERKLRGFASAYSALQDMFLERYGH